MILELVSQTMTKRQGVPVARAQRGLGKGMSRTLFIVGEEEGCE